jgi:hypothetical protein
MARYVKQTWTDGSGGGTPLSAARMGVIETGVLDGSSAVQLADSTAGGAVASFDFSSITATFSHLLILTYLRGDTAAAAVDVLIRFNNDSAANYDWLQNDLIPASNTPSSGAAATSARCGRCPANTATASEFATGRIDIAHYTGTTGHKIALGQSVGRETAGNLALRTTGAAWFAASAAINRVTILPGAGNFVLGSRVTIYGLA